MKKITRKIPATMVTQHPDHAAIPFWHNTAFIKASDETKECFLSFSELGADEYKWDWEGKLVDEAVIDRMLSDYHEYFQKNPLGNEKFLTYRLPNPKVETEFRLGRAFMGMLSASALAKHVLYQHDPLFEVILPMTETAEEMLAVQEAFAEIVSLKHPLLKHEATALKHIELIPLFEQIDVIATSSTILEQYITLHKKAFGYAPAYLRPYLARSDPALNAGMLPTVLSIKIALSQFKAFEKKYDIPLFPIIGAAALPFRGGLTPWTVDDFANEYAGVKTVTIQSGFKYDFPKPSVIAGIKRLKQRFATGVAKTISKKDESILRDVMRISTPLYQSVIEKIAPLVNEVSHFIPKRRERVQHVGLFGYSRGVGTVKLPRAIGFTAAMYSLGVPPEFIGTGRTIAWAKQQGIEKVIEKYYLNFKSDIVKSGFYLNKTNLAKLSKENAGWNMIAKDVKELEEYFGISFGPKTEEEKVHRDFTTKILALVKEKKDSTEYIEQAALLRRSLG